MSRETIANIDVAALRHNLGVVRRLAPDAEVMAVIKADGYGHGLKKVAAALSEADAFAVATLGAAEELRGDGWDGRLLLLEGFTNADGLARAAALRCEAVIHHESQLALLEAHTEKRLPQCWLKVNTGMNRLGFHPEAASAMRARLARLGYEQPVWMTHFACADDPESDMTQRQWRRFSDVIGTAAGSRSSANSAALMNFAPSRAGIVRPGIMLYGISPIEGRHGGDHGLRPVMTLRSQLIAINECAAGDSVGYGATWTAARDSRIGVVAIGYGDGYPRHAANGTPVLVSGQRVPMVGRVSMDMITVDLTEHAAAEVGDEVVLWGDGLPVEEVARCAGTIAYELVCGVTSRVRFE